MRLTDKRIQRLLLAAAIVGMLAAALVAYWPGLYGNFMFDDIPNIVRNPGLLIASLAPHQLLKAAFSSHSGLLYRPISMLSFALNDYFFGGNAFSFKLTNLIIHLVNALLILWLTRRLLINCKRRYHFEWSASVIGWASLLTAAAWALHPLNLTAVLYVVQRMTSLAALFTLAGMLAYVYGRERMQTGRTGWPLEWLLTPFFGVLGVLCKEDAALLPLYLLVIEWLIFGFRNSRQGLSKNTLIFYVIGLVLPGVIGLAFLFTHPGYFLGGYAGRDFTLPERVLTEFRVVFLYIKWTFIPNIRHLALYHDDLAVSTGLLHPLTTLWSLLVLIALLIIAGWQRQRRPLLSLGILFFFAGQTMESTVLPLELAFEHRNYLPDYGLILAVFSLLLLPVTATKPRIRLSLRWSIAVIILPLLFGGTLLRAWEWRNPLSFAYYESQHHPRSQRALYALGQAYSDLALTGSLKNPEIALHTLARAAAVSNNIMPDVAMLIVSAKLNLPVNPAWVAHAEWLLRNQPFNAQDSNSLNSLVNCLPTTCKVLVQPAWALLQTALQPGSGDKTSARDPDVWVIYANYLTFTGHSLSEVITVIRQSVKLAPANSQYRINLAKGLIVMGNFDAAEEQIQQLSRLNLFGSLDLDIKELKTNLAAGRAAAEKPEQPKP